MIVVSLDSSLPARVGRADALMVGAELELIEVERDAAGTRHPSVSRRALARLPGAKCVAVVEGACRCMARSAGRTYGIVAELFVAARRRPDGVAWALMPTACIASLADTARPVVNRARMRGPFPDGLGGRVYGA